MNKVWLILGLAALGLALFGYLHQEFIGASWDWSQLWHHEPLIILATGIGVTLVIVALINMGIAIVNKRR